MRKKIDATQEDYIVGLYFYEQYLSPNCWGNEKEAKNQFALLGSEVAKLQAIKEQHLIRTLGFGWDDAHHPWSKNGVTYSAQHLLGHLCKVFIPLAAKKTNPDEASEKLPTAPGVHTLGTLSAIGEELEIKGLA
jgi:hypothetical protein